MEYFKSNKQKQAGYKRIRDAENRVKRINDSMKKKRISRNKTDWTKDIDWKE